ncbi:hypothetical protein F4779DRAFT_595194 [Xylariaceae sp. FL0662B]|nr:hypothetical protein F4779DRAFT_595194 [Xylariaceae sp. FL0662B]
MFSPAVAPYINHFYPIGNTPAVNLTRGIPQGIDADILLLGCGDVRNILFTTYCERGFPPRKLDITCCDIEPAILARNILLFTLLIDGVDADTAWDIYFHFHVDNGTKEAITGQARKLMASYDTLLQWNQGAYGPILRFRDSSSFRTMMSIWEKYACPSKSETEFEKDLGRARDLLKTMNGGADSAGVLTGLRSAAPLAVAAMKEIPQAFRYFWARGHFSKHSVISPNPLFAETISANHYLHYGTDPILGFHLATAFASLAPASPLRPDLNPDLDRDGEIPDVVEAARVQFREWVAAFQGIPKGQITIWFSASDALSFCYALQHATISGVQDSGLYKQQFSKESFRFCPDLYSPGDSAPLTFDVVDTSNLTDHLGALNILVAVAPLLKSSASSVLHMETLIKTQKTRKQQLDSMLCGHAPTMFLLIGLAPVDYWTNATSVSYVDEILINSLSTSGDKTQAHSRLSWKPVTQLSQSDATSGPVSFDPHDLAKVLFRVYVEMFEHEDPSNLAGLDREAKMEKLAKTAYPLFHRGGFAMLIRHIQASISTEWPVFRSHLMQMIAQDSQNLGTLRNLYMQELGVQLHIHGVYSESWLSDVKPESGIGRLHAWRKIPEVVCLTAVVPRERINNLYSTKESMVNAPTFEGILESDHSMGWQNLFACVQVIFGKVETSHDQDEDECRITVCQDPLGLEGNSDMIASFYVPSSAIQVEPRNAKVGLSIQKTAMNVHTFKHVGPMMEVYTTKISNTSRVFVTRYMPEMDRYPFETRGESSVAEANASNISQSSTAILITPKMADNGVLSLCGHADILSQEGKALLANRVPITLRQPSPFSIDIVLGKNEMVCTIIFPIPVRKDTAITRIARTSGYVEVIAPLADPLTSEPLSSFMYPFALGENSVPVLLNSQNVNLDSLPILNVEQSQKKANKWINTLTSHQFSARERRLRDSGTSDRGLSTSLRLNFKESLFSMFMLASGLQGGSTGLFGLQHPTNGNEMLIFVRTIRLNGAESSIVLDAAVIPLTRQLLDSRALSKFFLILRELQIGAINIDDEELVLWKKVIPALAERCRTWDHGPECEYKRPGATIPLTVEPEKQFMCSCGNGKLPDRFTSLPEWDVASKYAVRVAISPIFAVPFVEDIIDPDMFKLQGGMANLQMDRCRKCNATQSKDGKKLLKCARCKDAMYCSQGCQKEDWKTHRMECSTLIRKG